MVLATILKESVRFAFNSLLANKLRTFLSLLGITIGIFAIISVFTVVDSLEKNIRESVSSLGNNVVYIQKWPWIFGDEYPWWKYINRPVPQVNELHELERRCTAAGAISYNLNFRKTIKYRSSSMENIEVVAVSHDFDRVKSFELEKGRYFTEQESKSGKPVVVLGADIASNLFGDLEPIDKVVKISGRNVQVIGVFKKEGNSILGISFDTQVLIPINFARSIVDLRGDRMDPLILAKAGPGISNEELKEELTAIMRGIRKTKPLQEDDFSLNETSLLSKGFDEVFSVIGLAGWVIGGFSILVGGFGIANIMFVSVKERTNVIGIQKSLGAKNHFILLQFLIESVVLSLLGGIFGLLIVFGCTALVSAAADIDIGLTTGNIILGLSVSGIIGIVSGFVPAYTASKLDPVVAIRS